MKIIWLGFIRIKWKSTIYNQTLRMVYLYSQVSRLRLLGDNVHSTRIAFVEFTMVSSTSQHAYSYELYVF